MNENRNLEVVSRLSDASAEGSKAEAVIVSFRLVRLAAKYGISVEEFRQKVKAEINDIIAESDPFQILPTPVCDNQELGPDSTGQR